ncbi:MAG: glycosyltransferase family 39 protein [Candidatus Eisenbacteria bacterium]|nr:glycosyltransferase family 39 protein [Candidatus Eisenbacteria bacterium]
MIKRATEPFEDRPRPLLTRIPGPSGEVLALFLVALVLRVGYVLAVHATNAQPSSDGITYDQLAWNLARGMGFQLQGEAALYPTAKAPLLPWMLSLLYRATGHSYFSALLLQCVIGAFVPVGVRTLGREMFGPSIGRIAGWLAVCHPLLIFFSGYLLTESLFCVLVLAALHSSVMWLKQPKGSRAFTAGVWWALATLTRPTALPLPFMVALWAWAPLGLMLQPAERAKQVGMVFLALVLVISPWAVRNTIVLGEFVLVTTGGGRTLLDANNAQVWDDPALRGNAISTAEVEPWKSKWEGLSETDVDRAASAEAIAFGLSRWKQWPEMALVKLARFWRPNAVTSSTGRWWARGSLPDRVLGTLDPLLLWSLLVWPMALWGLVRTVRFTRRHFQLLPFWVIALFTLSTMVFWGALRMRVPVEPLVLLYAGAGIADVLWRVRMRRAGLALIASATKR